MCPADIRIRPETSARGAATEAFWDEPEVKYHVGFDFSISSSHLSGATFPVGATTVDYSAENMATGEVYTCSFLVEVLEKDCESGFEWC